MSKDETTAKVGLVTGGTRGIGRAVVEELLDVGWEVWFCGRSSESVDGALQELNSKRSGRVRGRVVDVRDGDAVSSFVGEIAESAGRLDCLVNNAGLGRFGAIQCLSQEDWDLVLRTNLDGCFNTLRAVAPLMVEQHCGWIFNVASLAAKHSFAGGAAYNASKFGLLGLSEAAMLDLRPHGVRVTTVLPGSVDTDFRLPGSKAATDWMLRPEDVAQVIVDFLKYPARALPSQIEIRPTQTSS